MRKFFKFIVGILALIGGIVCIIAIVLVIRFYVDINLETEDLAIADSGWSEVANAWVDADKDGNWDSDEKPLEGVHFVVDNVNSDNFSPYEATSNKNGKAELIIFPLDCNVNTTKVILYAIPPNGYKPTTSWRVTVPNDVVSGIAPGNFQFGFVEK